MIAMIEGRVVERGADGVVVMTPGGVGYRLHVSFHTLEQLGGEETVTLHTHLAVREDAQELFGFADAAERDAFLLLVSISGIGPRLALGILSGLTVDELAAAVLAGDVKRLAATPGIGKKIAERLILELKEKVVTLGSGVAATNPPATAGGAPVLDDLRSALANLGYRTAVVDRMVAAVEKTLEPDQPVPPLETLLREALRLNR